MGWTLTMRRWRNSDQASTIIALLRYLPYIACVVGLKVYVMMLLVHSRDDIGDYDDYSLRREDPRPRTTTPTTTTEEPGWREKQEVLARLDDTVILPSAANRTPDTIWLFFNRVPRTGGQTLVSLLKSLAHDLDYQHQEHVYRTPWQRLMSDEEQKNLATWFEYNFWPKSYDRFSLFINFTKHRSQYVSQRPAYITLVRDPVEKYISHFRFKRVNQERVKLEMALREKQRPGSGRTWYWRKLEECVLENDTECDLKSDTNDFTSAIPFLCGQDEPCLKLGNKWALQKAKFHAEYEYSVVGLAEHWNTTLGVLEHYLPMFFQGARQRYWSQEFEDQRLVNKNPKKYPKVSEQVLTVLRQRLGLEYELYDFLRQRLHLQHQQVAEKLAAPTTELPTRPTEVPRLAVWDRMDIELRH
ncbi:heparan sulfate 2-O-sulfotransferase pipe [Procambarus clarkii]|uniref:heparan sulfate 2-O-sulfotransferase pipe n=1 Tax=Procambarus clarkii TaxID=6728 RepID=UPI003743534A